MKREAIFELTILSADTIEEMEELRRSYRDRGYSVTQAFNPSMYDPEAKRFSCAVVRETGSVTEEDGLTDPDPLRVISEPEPRIDPPG
jgi:hypothetical protein